jgi:hypothetical protein
VIGAATGKTRVTLAFCARSAAPASMVGCPRRSPNDPTAAAKLNAS